MLPMFVLKPNHILYFRRKTLTGIAKANSELNWTECEKAIHAILVESAEGIRLEGDFNAFVAAAESEIASFINEHFGLQADKT